MVPASSAQMRGVSSRYRGPTTGFYRCDVRPSNVHWSSRMAFDIEVPGGPMTSPGAASEPTRRALPLILIRGFGGLSVEDEKQIAYQGFNDGTVYPQKRGENYIYEGLILRLMKSDWEYHDATNVVGYYAEPISQAPAIPPQLAEFDPGFFSGHKIVIDPATALALKRSSRDVMRSVWVFRYYDLNDRTFGTYGAALVRLIDFIRELARQE